MNLYRVCHVHRGGQASYDNCVVAASAGDAISQRQIVLGLDDDDPAWDVTVEAVADPDGSRARRWLAHFGEDA